MACHWDIKYSWNAVLSCIYISIFTELLVKNASDSRPNFILLGSVNSRRQSMYSGSIKTLRRRMQGSLTERGRISTVDLLGLFCLVSTVFHTEAILLFMTKQPNLMKRSTVLRFPFPGRRLTAKGHTTFPGCRYSVTIAN